MKNSEATVQIEHEEKQNVCLNRFADQSTQNDITIDVSIPQQYSLVRDNEIIMPTFNLLMFIRDTFLTLLIYGPNRL